MPEVAVALSNVYFDTAATSLLYDFSIFNYVVDILGADKILFGTDYPLLNQGKQMRRVQSLYLPNETKKLILGGNAERFPSRTLRAGSVMGALTFLPQRTCLRLSLSFQMKMVWTYFRSAGYPVIMRGNGLTPTVCPTLIGTTRA